MKREMLKSILAKMILLEQELSRAQGAFVLFALIKREESSWWTVVVSAPWLEKYRQNGRIATRSKNPFDIYEPERDLFYDRFVKALTIEELVALTSAKIYAPSTPFVKEMNEYLLDELGGPIEHGQVKFQDWEVDGIEIERGYIITCNSANALPAEAVTQAA